MASRGLNQEEYERWRRLWSSRSQEQRERIKRKADWEHVSILGVFWNWPSLFGEEGEALHEEFSSQ